MTKEELEKEAEEKYSEVDREFVDCQDEGEIFNLGYLAGAEPREKQIAEFEKENAELKLKLEALEGQTPWKDIKDKSEVIGKLTKAIEIIKKYMRFKPVVGGVQYYHEEYSKTEKEAKQFLKEEA